MGTSYAPNIVKEDLVLYWDPKNIRSWTPGSDTVNGLAGTPTGSIFNHIGFNTGTGDAYGISSTQISDAGATNSWTQWVYVMHSNVSYTNNKIYVNSVNQTLSAQNGASEAPSNRNFNSGYGNIGVWGASGQPGGGTSLFLLGECGNFKIYNRELSAQEVKQNYNALKGRFGL
jgi:hypothetical protein